MTTNQRLIDVSKLQQAAVIWDKGLRALPYVGLKEVAAALGLNVMELQGKHSIVNERRRAGGTQSYNVGKEFAELANILGYDPSEIEPKDVVFVTKENSKKYNDNELLIVGGSAVDNKSKKHPLETRIVFAQTTSHCEDVAYALCGAERDEASSSPDGAFDGMHTIINKIITAGDVNVARGNLSITGEFIDPTKTGDTTDCSAYEQLVDFIGNTHNALRSSKGGIPQLQVTQTVLKAARAALRNKLKQLEYPSIQRMLEHLREDAFCPSLIFATHECLGSGSRLTLQKVGNIDLAINTQAAAKFVQIRDIFEDPNTWQFWLQAGYGLRVRDWHEKVFCTNEQKNSYLDLSGDYCQTGGIQANITGAAGKWKIGASGDERASGSYATGLAPGTHVIKFTAVSGKTAPADQSVVVKEGQVTTITGAYT